MSALATPSVTVLLCTYNGDAYVAAQLDSVFAQHGCDIKVVVSDDGSQDATQAILTRYAETHQGLQWRPGPGRGFVRNFFSLIGDAAIDNDYFALADQDDLWQPEHLSRAVQWLAAAPEGVPALFASRTCLTDGEGREIGLSPKHARQPNFQNALIQNIASGNTMVFNRAARELLARLGEQAMPVWHDWALYQVVTACGGRVFYDQAPSVLYRQHGRNAIGAQWTWRSRWQRVRLLAQGRFRDWNAQNLKALASIEAHMTPESRELLHGFATLRAMHSPWGRARALHRLGLYRQTRLGQAGLYLAALTGLI